MSVGFNLLAFGSPYYLVECALAAKTIKANSGHPIALITDMPEKAVKLDFDEVVWYEKCALDDTASNSFEKNCLVPRLKLPLFSPFDKSITVDSDVLTIGNPSIAF